MPIDKDWVIEHVDVFWPIIKDALDYEDFKKICLEFSKYEDINKVFIPYNICDFIEASKKLGYDNPRLSGIQIILLLSIIEALSIRIKYITFSKWYSNNSEFQKNKKCLESYDNYLKIFCTSKYLRNFFRMIDDDEKKELLTKIYTKYDDVNAPFCYRSRRECFHSVGGRTTIKDGKIVHEDFG